MTLTNHLPLIPTYTECKEYKLTTAVVGYGRYTLAFNFVTCEQTVVHGTRSITWVCLSLIMQYTPIVLVGTNLPKICFYWICGSPG